MAQLDAGEVTRRLAEVPGWELVGKEIRRQYTFPDFADAMVFVNRVAILAGKVDHHPDIDIRYNKVSLVLSTHSEGGLTNKDFDLAKGIDAGDKD
jgi:4a-hydroxytetrahydrobiopterin dehydratase